MATQRRDADPMPLKSRAAGRTRSPDRPPDRTSDRPGHDPRDRPDDQPSQQPKRSGGQRGGSTGPEPIAEWTTLAISSLIVLGLIGVTTYFYVTSSDAPAMVEVEPHPTQTYQAGSRFYLPVTVRNGGGETGEEVRVRVTVSDPSGRQETAEFQVQFLAGGGTSRAVVAFGSDPRQGQIEAGVMSYLEP